MEFAGDCSQLKHSLISHVIDAIWQKLTGTAKNLGVGTFPDPSAIFGPLAAILVLQVVRRCRQWASSPGATRLVYLDFS